MRKVYFYLFSILLFLFAIRTQAQVAGDYRTASGGATMNWNSTAKWEILQPDGVTWANLPTQTYPGSAGPTTATVYITYGDNVTLNVTSITIGGLVIGNSAGKTSTTNATQVSMGTNTLTVNGGVSLNAAAGFQPGTLSNSGTLTISGILSVATGSTVTNNGTINTTNISTSALTSGLTWGGTINYNVSGGGQTIIAGTYNNLTLSNTSGTDNAGGALTVNGSLTTTAGGILNMGTYVLSGSLTTISNSGTIATSNTSAAPIPSSKTWGGTINYAVTSGAQTIVAGTYNNLTLSNTSGTDNAGGAISVNGSLNTGAGGTLSMGTYILSGTLSTISNLGNISTSVPTATTSTPIPSSKTWGGSITYNASLGGQTIVAGTYNNLTLTNTSGTDNAGGPITVNGGLTTTAGGILSMGTYVLSGTLSTISNAGTISTSVPTSSSSIPLPSAKSWGGTIIYNASTGVQTIVAGTYNNLVLNNINGANVSGNVTTTSLNLTSGTLGFDVYTLTINGAVSGTGTLNSTANSNLTIGGSAGTLYFTSGAKLKNFTVSGSATIGSAVRLTGGTATTAAGILTIGSNATLNTGGLLTIGSNQYGTASVATVGTSGNINGNVTVERYIGSNSLGTGRDGKAWRLVTAPVHGTTINAAWQEAEYYNSPNHYATGTTTPSVTPPAGYGTIITANGPDQASTATNNGFDFWPALVGKSSSIRKYYIYPSGDPQYKQGTWAYGINMATTSPNSLDWGVAYMLYVRGDRTVTTGTANSTTLRATGSLKIGQVQETVVGSGTQLYTLIGNPYASPIDFDGIYNRATSAIKARFWLWDANLNTVGGYRLLYKNSSGSYTSTPYDFLGDSLTGNQTIGSTYHYIESGAAFFVEPVGSSNATFTIEESDKVSSTPSGTLFRVANSQLRTTSKEKNIYVNLIAGTSTSHFLADGVTINIAEGYSSGYGEEDIGKPMNMNEALSVSVNNKMLMVEGRPEVKSDTIQLSLTGTTTRNYELQVKANNFNNASVAYLEDSYTKSRTVLDMTGGITTYDFVVNADATSKAADRFRIVMARAPGLLPDHLTLIKATPKDKSINVDWEVNTDQNTVRYQVERSTDGVNFSSIGTVASKASATSADYQLADNAPVTGTNYYRIEAIDAFGKSSFSTIAKGVIGTGSLKFVVYPNPVKSSTFSLQFPDMPAGNYNIRMFNNNGQLIYQQGMQHEGGWASQSLTIPNQLPPGIYNVEVSGTTGSKFNQQLIKQ